MGRPPPAPIIRAMPERKRFFFIEAFPKLSRAINCAGARGGDRPPEENQPATEVSAGGNSSQEINAREQSTDS